MSEHVQIIGLLRPSPTGGREFVIDGEWQLMSPTGAPLESRPYMSVLLVGAVVELATSRADTWVRGRLIEENGRRAWRGDFTGRVLDLEVLADARRNVRLLLGEVA